MVRRLISSLMIVTLLMTLSPMKGYTDSTKTEKIIAIANEQLGVPYRFGGSSPSGFDCSGFLQYVFDKADISLPRTTSEQYKVGDSVKKSELKAGDLVFFETYKPGPSHSGIYVGDHKFIHASSSNGISISSVNDPYYWNSRYLGAKRVFKEPEPVVKTLEALPKGEYHDIGEDFWAYEELRWLGEKDFISGNAQSLFLPNEFLTKAEASVIFAKALDLPTDHTENEFSDVPDDHWAAGAITAVANEEIIRGTSSTLFDLDRVLTREQVAVILSRAFDLKASDEKAVAFNDVNEADHAYDEIQLLASNGITSGYDGNLYRPEHNVTRVEFAVFTYRALHIE